MKIEQGIKKPRTALLGVLNFLMTISSIAAVGLYITILSGYVVSEGGAITSLFSGVTTITS